MQQDSTRRSAEEILEQVIENGRDELSRSTIGLMFSGFAGGLSMGLTGLAVALALSYLGKGAAPGIFLLLFLSHRIHCCGDWKGTTFYGKHALPCRAGAG
jgi:formate/nitrite transporter FocA (FNT family)